MGSSFFVVCFLVGALDKCLLVLLALLAGIVCLTAAVIDAQKGRFLVVISAAAALACLCVFGQTRNWDRILPLDGIQGQTKAVVTDISTQDAQSYAYTLKVRQVGKTSVSFTTILYTNSKLDVDFYDELSCELVFFKPNSSPSFAAEGYYRSKNIPLLAAFVQEGTNITVLSPDCKPLWHPIKRLGQTILTKVQQALPAEEAGVFCAMLLGRDELLDPVLWQTYSQSGVCHLFAVSGLHITILVGFLLGILRCLGRKERLSSLLAILLIGAFVCFSGASVSALRAGLMAVLLLCGKMAHRPADTLNSLGLAAFLLMAANPFVVWNPSFFLSFGATLGIVLYADPLYHKIKTRCGLRSRWLCKVLQTFCVPFCANLFLFPLLFFQYRTFSPVSFLLNPLLAPLITAVMIVGFLTLTVLALPLPAFVSGAFCAASYRLIELQNRCVAWAAKLPFATVGLHDPIFYAGIGFCVLLGVLAMVQRRRKKSYRPYLVCLFIILLLSYTTAFWHRQTTLSLDTVSDGNTCAVVLHKGDHAVVLVPKNQGGLLETTYRFLLSKDITQVDGLFLLEGDHTAHSDLQFFLSCMPVGQVWFHPDTDPTVLAASPCEESHPIRPMQVTFADTTLTFTQVKRSIRVQIETPTALWLMTNQEEDILSGQAEHILFFGTWRQTVPLSHPHTVLLVEPYTPLPKGSRYINATHQNQSLSP